MKKPALLLLIFLLFTFFHLHSQEARRTFEFISPGESPDEVAVRAGHIVPSPQQLAWQSLEFTAFAHFGLNTFTDKEWGDGTESPEIFNPTDLDAAQWVRTYKDAGMKMLVIVAKHHDGFCLWPSKYTKYSVKSSPWKKGKGDLVGELAAACREYGLKVGIYLSPWDRHEKSYGDSPAYNKYYMNQLRELLTGYGEISEVWFDGACAEGPNGKKQEYDWAGYYALIRELQPNALIFGQGPDIRWVGTETGYGRESEWSVVPAPVKNLSNINALSPWPLDNAYIPGDMTGEDLGSTEMLSKVRVIFWYPAEADVSIRPGWFYHENQNSEVKTPEQLVDIFFGSVGRNCVLLLNVPPDKRGLIRDEDIQSLMGMRKFLRQTFYRNLAADGILTCYDPVNDKNLYTMKNTSLYWKANQKFDSSVLVMELPSPEQFDVLMLQESLRDGQRIGKFRFEFLDGKNWVKVAEGTTVGYKRLLRFPAVKAKTVRLIIEESRGPATLTGFDLYKTPERVNP